MHDLLITGGAIIDGTGADRFRGDVAVTAGRLADVGDLSAADAVQTIDATDRVVAPGFIDVHNHSDGWLQLQANLSAKTLQGFTTEVLQSDGLGYAPLEAADAPDWFHYLRTLDGLPLERYAGWQSLAEYLDHLDGATAQNVAVQIPYANLRVMACGWGRAAADDSQIQIIRRLVERGLDDGAVALSTGLDYVAQCFASTDEIARAAAPLAAAGAPYVTHVRYKAGLLAGLDEAIDITDRAGCPLHISHLKPVAPGQAEPLLDLINRVVDSQRGFSYDLYPYLPGSTMLASLLPYEVWQDGPLAAIKKLADPTLRRRTGVLLEAHRTALEQVRIAWVEGAAGEMAAGHTVASFVASTGKSVGDAFCDLMVDCNLAALGVFDIGDDRLAHPFLRHPAQMVGSDGILAPAGRVHPRAYGTAPRMLGPLVRDHELFSLETAVHKMTGFPARVFGLADRGAIRKGAHADLVIFDAATVADRATYEHPDRPPVGIEHVLVNGTSVVTGGAPVTNFERPPGRALRRAES